MVTKIAKKRPFHRRVSIAKVIFILVFTAIEALLLFLVVLNLWESITDRPVPGMALLNYTIAAFHFHFNPTGYGNLSIPALEQNAVIRITSGTLLGLIVVGLVLYVYLQARRVLMEEEGERAGVRRL